MQHRFRLGLIAMPAAVGVMLAGCSTGTPEPERTLRSDATSIAQCITDTTGGAVVEDKEAVKLNLMTHDAAAAASLERRAAEISSLPDSPYTYEIVESISSAQDVATKGLGALTAQTGVPDIMGFDSTLFSSLMPFAADDLYDFTGMLSEIAPDRIASRDAVWSVDGRLYGIESGYGLGAYYYNADQFEQLGIDPADLKTWDDVIRIGAEKAAPNGQALIGIATGSGSFLYALAQRGGGMFDESGNVTLDTPEAAEALQMLVDGIDAGAFRVFSEADYTGAANYAAMQNHEVLGYAYPDWWLAYIMKPQLTDQAGQWRAMPQPQFADGGYATGFASGHAWTVYKKGEHAEAAALLIKCGQGTTEAQVQMFVESGYLPHNASAFQDAQLQAFTDPFLGDQQVVAEVYEAVAADAPVVINSPNWGQAQQILSQEITEVLTGRKSVEDGLSSAQRLIEEAIAKG